MMEKKLYKSRQDKVLGGVCGGIAEYFGIDPVIVRLLVVVFTVMGGAGLIAYIVAAIIIPYPPDFSQAEESYQTFTNEDGESDAVGNSGTPKKSDTGGLPAFGIILIILGAFVLLKGFIPWIPNEVIFAVVLILLGAYFIAKK